MENTEFLENNIHNFDLILKANGITSIKGNHIGQISINKNSKTALIEIKQCAEPQNIAYFEGHLLCKDITYKLLPTEIDSAVFNLNTDRTNYNRYELQLNNNRQGIIINCSKIELIDYKQINKSIEEYKNLYVSNLYGRYFSIIEYNDFTVNYIKCPDCNNILDMSFVNKRCPNPLCSFNFDGLEPLLYKNDISLHKELLDAYKGKNEDEKKLLATAIRFNIGQFLSHFIICDWGVHYQTLFKDFIILYLDDINVLKMVLSSDAITADKNNIVTSKNGYKMFWDLYEYLMKVHNQNIREFLRFEFPLFYRKNLNNLHKKLIKEKDILTNHNKSKLL